MNYLRRCTKSGFLNILEETNKKTLRSSSKFPNHISLELNLRRSDEIF
jgi:hypothetical protein